MTKNTSKNVVEINGRLYDAVTGLPLSTPIHKNPTKPQVIDGFVKHKKTKPAPNPKKLTAHDLAPHSRSIHSKTQRSKTLNRQAAAKQRASLIKPARSKSSQDPKRLARATQTKRSSIIQKFASSSPNKSITPASVAIPSIQVASRQQRTSAPPPTAKEHLIAAAMQSVQPVRTRTKRTFRQKAQSFIARKPKAMSLAATSIAALLIVGYVVYLNVPNMALRVAAREAGFDARMPGYQPTGFRFGSPITYEPGQITIHFNSNTDERSFSIAQRETNWDSQSLLDNYVASTGGLYQTYQDRGLTIYVYDGSNATWVNGGIWYTIEGQSLLNAEQLIKIAGSI